MIETLLVILVAFNTVAMIGLWIVAHKLVDDRTLLWKAINRLVSRELRR